MTKIIKWRLKELPSAQMLKELVADKLITKDEAREIMFSLEEEGRDKKSLEQEIKFLRELVDKLSARSQIVEIIREIRSPYQQYSWYSPYYQWCSSETSGTSYTTTNALYTDSNNTSVLNNLTAGVAAGNTAITVNTEGNVVNAMQVGWDAGQHSEVSSFSDIKTF